MSPSGGIVGSESQQIKIIVMIIKGFYMASTFELYPLKKPVRSPKLFYLDKKEQTRA